MRSQCTRQVTSLIRHYLQVSCTTNSPVVVSKQNQAFDIIKKIKMSLGFVMSVVRDDYYDISDNNYINNGKAKHGISP